LHQLHRHGIRTAGDLERAWRGTKQRGEEAKFLNILNGQDGGEDREWLQIVLDTIRDDEWMPYIRRWHSSNMLEGDEGIIEILKSPEALYEPVSTSYTNSM
jgi:hypothetical protein